MGPFLNIGTGITTSVKELAYLMIELSGKSLEPDYAELVKITDSFAKLAERAEDKTKTLKELSNESNPLTEVNSSAELLEKVQILAQSLEDKTQELSELYKSNEKALLDSYGESIANYSNQINSASSPDEIIALFPQIESLLKEIEGLDFFAIEFVWNAIQKARIQNNF